jgi:hypothetical protein
MCMRLGGLCNMCLHTYVYARVRTLTLQAARQGAQSRQSHSRRGVAHTVIPRMRLPPLCGASPHPSPWPRTPPLTRSLGIIALPGALAMPPYSLDPGAIGLSTIPVGVGCERKPHARLCLPRPPPASAWLLGVEDAPSRLAQQPPAAASAGGLFEMRRRGARLPPAHRLLKGVAEGRCPPFRPSHGFSPPPPGGDANAIATTPAAAAATATTTTAATAAATTAAAATTTNNNAAKENHHKTTTLHPQIPPVFATRRHARGLGRAPPLRAPLWPHAAGHPDDADPVPGRDDRVRLGPAARRPPRGGSHDERLHGRGDVHLHARCAGGAPRVGAS